MEESIDRFIHDSIVGRRRKGVMGPSGKRHVLGVCRAMASSCIAVLCFLVAMV